MARVRLIRGVVGHCVKGEGWGEETVGVICAMEQQTAQQWDEMQSALHVWWDGVRSVEIVDRDKLSTSW